MAEKAWGLEIDVEITIKRNVIKIRCDYISYELII